MGINKASIAALMMEGKQRPYTGCALTFGRQFVSVSCAEVLTIAKDVGFLVKSEYSESTASLTINNSDDWITDIQLFKLLGFKEVIALDCDNY